MKRHIFTYTARELLPLINWSYFMHAWGIKPQDYESDTARQIKQDAIELLQKEKDRILAKAIFALCDAHSRNEDIIIDGEKIPMLRQQHAKDGMPNLCLSDFISPTNDKIGVFATSVVPNFEENGNNDEYRRLLKQTTAHRLAEAAATLIHQKARTDITLWGYSPDEQADIDDLHHERHRGIRPAVGYPSLPDQTIIFIIDRIIRLSDIGIRLTDNGAMTPHASVCGLMFAHPAARYFSVGRITDEQLENYSQRHGIPPEELAKFLVKNIE